MSVRDAPREPDPDSDRLEPDFHRLWCAQTVSGFGARITREALPLAGVLTLGAQPAQLGLLAAMATAPQIFLGLLAGGLVDRSSRRGILIGADVARGVILVTVPIAAFFHLLSLVQLYIVALLIGSASVMSDLAGHALVPGMLGPRLLAKGNTRLSITDSLAEISSPALTGVLIQLLTAPLAIGIDVLTYVFSAGLLLTIGEKRRPEPDRHARRTWRADFGVALRTIRQTAVVRTVFLMDLTTTLFGAMLGSVYIFYAVKELHLSPTMVGFVFAAGGLGALLGALTRSRVTRRLGLGVTILTAAFVGSASNFILPFVHGSPWEAAIVLAALRLGSSALAVLAGVSIGTLRQTLVPGELLGRVAAAFQVGIGAVAIGGALIGGYLGQAIGARETMVIAACGLTSAGLWGVLSPLLGLKVMPSGGEAPLSAGSPS